MEALAHRGYEPRDFPDGIPSSCLYIAWQRKSFTTLERHFASIAQEAVERAVQLTGKPYARCSCGEPIHEHEMSAGLIAEVVRGGKHILIHYDSCRREGDELA